MKWIFFLLLFFPVCSFAGIEVIQEDSAFIIFDVSRSTISDYHIISSTFQIAAGSTVIAIQIRSTTPVVENVGRFYNFQINVEGAVSSSDDPIDITGLFHTIGTPAISVIDQSGIVFGNKDSLESIRNIRLNLRFFNPSQILSPSTISASKSYRITISKTPI